jgi:UDP-glucose 4-epimerase
MRILFTGASSFTGYWFVKALAAAGHEVVATFRSPPTDYTDIRGQRVKELIPLCRFVQCAFGDQPFFNLVRGNPWDLLCHHAADVTNYKRPDFNIVAALENNTRNVAAVLSALQASGCNRVLLTGSVFECDEGAGEHPRRAVSPYGLSKALTAQVFRYHTQILGMTLGKFVIPNPFGPLEEPRFTTYLVRSWYERKVPAVSTPDYVRDNIHVSLLASSYRAFAESLSPGAGLLRLNPSGYIESQGAFAQRFAAELRPRLGMDCTLDLKVQREFPEPRIRINTDQPDLRALKWDEGEAWNELARYYRDTLEQPRGAWKL